jgi:hypothetical protein
MKKPILLLFLTLITKFSFCQLNHPQNRQDLIAICDKFMDAFKSERFDKAFDLIKPYSVIENYKLDTLASTVSRQVGGLSSVYGKLIGYEQVSDKQVKYSLVKLVYMIKFEKGFLELHFILYNNGTGWTITNFKYDEKTDDLF